MPKLYSHTTKRLYKKTLSQLYNVSDFRPFKGDFINSSKLIKDLRWGNTLKSGDTVYSIFGNKEHVIDTIVKNWYYYNGCGYVVDIGIITVDGYFLEINGAPNRLNHIKVNLDK